VSLVVRFDVAKRRRQWGRAAKTKGRFELYRRGGLKAAFTSTQQGLLAARDSDEMV